MSQDAALLNMDNNDPFDDGEAHRHARLRSAAFRLQKHELRGGETQNAEADRTFEIGAGNKGFFLRVFGEAAGQAGPDPVSSKTPATSKGRWHPSGTAILPRGSDLFYKRGPAIASGELARFAGASPDTLRHNERAGVLAKPSRSANDFITSEGQFGVELGLSRPHVNYHPRSPIFWSREDPWHSIS